MDADFSDFVLDREKYSQLSLDEKRELVHGISRWSKDAPKILISWSRQELVDLISAELGMERKYTGVIKSRLIERLLKLISEDSGNSTDDMTAISLAKIGSKRQRKKDYPVLSASGQLDNSLRENHETKRLDTLVCQNLACRATLTPDSKFCKRCSCCICFHYDDNKDPSLWLTCDSDPHHDQEDSCGLSCHLRCALKHESAGIMINGSCPKLDGSYYCVSCGKVNGIMGIWRKQLLVARDSRRVDVLCQRICLSHKILEGTEQYKEQQDIVVAIVEKLNSEVGPIDQVSSEMARGLVGRLSCGVEIQQLCASALESIDSLLPVICSHQNDNEGRLTCRIRFEEVSAVSVVLVLAYGDKLLRDFLGCRIWHRKSTAVDYPEKATYIVLRPEKKFVILDLDPSTKYFFRVSLFSSSKELGVWESTCITQAPSESLFSALDNEHGKEQAIIGHDNSQRDSTNSSDDKLACSDNHSKVRSLEDISKNDECQLPSRGTDGVTSTPCKSDGTQEVPSSTSKKHSDESNYEYCARVIRWLEREGYMEKDFRVKFLTWFSLKSTMQDRRIVSTFVDNLIDDPASLAAQLVDSFTDEMNNKNKRIPRPVSKKLWH